MTCKLSAQPYLLGVARLAGVFGTAFCLSTVVVARRAEKRELLRFRTLVVLWFLRRPAEIIIGCITRCKAATAMCTSDKLTTLQLCKSKGHISQIRFCCDAEDRSGEVCSSVFDFVALSV